jgi:hypothetical protein
MRPLYFLYHIPKTGGQSIRDHLERHLERDRDFLHLGKWDRAGPLGREDVESMVDHERTRLRTIGGHPLRRDFRELFPGRVIREVVFVREPARRIVSHYNFHATMAEGRGESVPSFVDFVDSRPANAMTDFLAKTLQPPRNGVAMLAAVLAELSKVWMVGTTESMDELTPALFEAIGIEPGPFPRSNVTGEGIRPHMTLTPDLADELRAANPLDVMLYRACLRLERRTMERLGLRDKQLPRRPVGFVP